MKSNKLDSILNNNFSITKIDLSILSIPPAPLVYYPGPQYLDPVLPDSMLAVELQKIYLRWRSKLGIKGNCNDLFSTYYKSLRTAARWLADNKIPPRVWFLWSIYIWPCHDGKKSATKLPTIGWIWSPKRMRERNDWFRQEWQNYFGNHIISTKAYKKLLALQTNAQVAVLLGKMDLQHAKEKYLPHEKVSKLYTKALEEAATLRNKYERQLSSVDLPDYVVF